MTFCQFIIYLAKTFLLNLKLGLSAADQTFDDEIQSVNKKQDKITGFECKTNKNKSYVNPQNM